jgi:hypothetical protein
MKRRNFLLGAPALFLAKPAFANGELMVRGYRDNILERYQRLEAISDNSHLADARRMLLLYQIQWWRDQIMRDLWSMTDLQPLLRREPERVIPQFVTPIEDQIASQQQRIGDASLALFNSLSPSVAQLIDAAAAEAAAVAGFRWRLFIRMAAVARLANDGERWRTLGTMASELDRYIVDTAEQQGQSLRSHRSALPAAFHEAGLDREADYFAREFFRNHRPDNSSDVVSCRLVLDELSWREGRLTASEVETRARDGLAALPDEMRDWPWFSSYSDSRYQLLRFLNTAGEEERLRIWLADMAAWVGSLPNNGRMPHTNFSPLYLAVCRMGRSDLAYRVPHVATEAYYGAMRSLDVPDIEAHLQGPMLIAAYTGQVEIVEEFRQRVVDAFRSVQPMVGAPPGDPASHFNRYSPLAGLAEAAAYDGRSP